MYSKVFLKKKNKLSRFSMMVSLKNEFGDVLWGFSWKKTSFGLKKCSLDYFIIHESWGSTLRGLKTSFG
jgi:hypothetical protein